MVIIGGDFRRRALVMPDVFVMPADMTMDDRSMLRGQMRMDMVWRDQSRHDPHQLKRRDEERLQRPHGVRL